jgi:hypothetical protein
LTPVRAQFGAQFVDAINTFTPEQHQAALVRRRIRFVVEKGAMARLFKAGTNGRLQDELFAVLQPKTLAGLKTIEEYDGRLVRTIELPCWANCSSNGMKVDRWA